VSSCWFLSFFSVSVFLFLLHCVQFIQIFPKILSCRSCQNSLKFFWDKIELLNCNFFTSIGDGGNDVSMIQAANVGVGLVGKEGRQASLAADFSILQFNHIRSLFLVSPYDVYLNVLVFSCFTIYIIRSAF